MPRILTHYLTITFLLAITTLKALAVPTIAVTVLTDREDALYAVGDTATFQIRVVDGDMAVTEGTVAWVLNNDGANTIDSGTIALATEPVVITGTLNHPGFLRCTVTFVDGSGQKYVGLGGAGFEPLHIKASMPVPEDFDAFWTAKREAINALPMNPTLTSVTSKVAQVDCFDLQLECLGGAPVSGYYCRPTGALPKSLPALLTVHGAGVRSSTLHPDLAAQGMLVLDINAHGIPNGKPKAYYDALAKGDLADYRIRGREDRETYYFLGMYYRLIRALNFLAAQPEWDGQVLMVSGSSQGGGQSLVAAGLDSRVTALMSNVPAMCEHTGDINGWPRLVPRDGDGTPDATVLQVSRYFDAMNFATRTSADALLAVGFVDDTCRPTTVYAAYNNLRGAKEIINKPQMAHAVPPEWGGKTRAFMKAHIARVKK